MPEGGRVFNLANPASSSCAISQGGRIAGNRAGNGHFRATRRPAICLSRGVENERARGGQFKTSTPFQWCKGGSPSLS
jgi:hypothetical protein